MFHVQLNVSRLPRRFLCLQVKDFRSLPVDSHPDRLGPQDREEEASVQPGWPSEITSERSFITAVNITAVILSDGGGSEVTLPDWKLSI